MIHQPNTRSLVGIIMVSFGILAVLPKVTTVDVVGKKLSLEKCQVIFAKGDCDDVGPQTSCGQEEYCSENQCTGIAYQPEEGAAFVKDCQKINTRNIELIWDCYYMWLENQDTGFNDMLGGYGKCIEKCLCSDFCTDHDEGPGKNYVCDTTEDCLETGNFHGVEAWDTEDTCNSGG